MYRHRFLEDKIRNTVKKFKAVLVTGPRQAGKTSLLNHMTDSLFAGKAHTVSFDTPSEIDAFRRDPDLFFINNPGLLFLDEIQHVPDIFPYLKREIDRSEDFRFFLSGSQHFELMKGVTESLAGRVAVLDLWPFATAEIRGAPTLAASVIELLEQPEKLEAFIGRTYQANDYADVVPAMLAGGYPPVVLEDGGADWLESYRRTYIQRDIREISQVADLGRFDRFLTLCAGRSSQVLNKAEISRTIGIDNKTVDSWLSVLETSYQMVSLPAWHGNHTKRLVRRAKWVFADSGLCLHLQAIRDSAALLNAPHFGHLFETFVLMEIRKLYGHLGLAWSAYFWRTSSGLECDLVLAVAGKLVPVEIKHTASPSTSDISALKAFIDSYKNLATTGVLICLKPEVEKISRNVYSLPLGMLLNGP